MVHSAGFRDDLWIDNVGSMITSDAKVEERIRRLDYSHLDVKLTVDDPKAYTKPWTVTLHQRLNWWMRSVWRTRTTRGHINSDSVKHREVRIP